MTSPNDLTRQQLDELDALLQRMLALPINHAEPAGPSLSPPPPLPEMPAPTPRPSASVGWRADLAAQASKAPYLVPALSPEPALSVVPGTGPEPTDHPGPNPAHDLEALAIGRMSVQHELPTTAELYQPEPDVLPMPSPTVRAKTVRGVDAPDRPMPSKSEELQFTVAEDALPSVFGHTNGDYEVELQSVAAKPTQAPVPMVLWPLFAMNWTLEYILSWFGPIGYLMTRPRVKTILGFAGLLLLLGAGAWTAQGLGWVSLWR